MKKLYTLLLSCLIGTIGAWGETTTLLEYGTSNVAWTDALVSSWTTSGSPTVTNVSNTYMQVAGGNGENYAQKTISPKANSIINVTAVWRGKIGTGRYFSGGNGSYFRFGNILVAESDQDKKHAYTFSGYSGIPTATTFTAGSYRVDIESMAFLLIEMEINTATDTLRSFTIKSEDGNTTYVSQKNIYLGNTADYATLAIGFHKVQGATNNWENLKSIKITETTQNVTTAGYTINYIFDKDTINQAQNTTAVGSTVNAESPITIDGTKYYAADGTTTSMTITSDATANVLNVNLRKALTKTVSIIAVDGDGNELKRFSTECIEGEAAKNLFYTRAVEKDGEYYTIAAANANGVNYGNSVSYTSSDENKIYTLDKSITYYAEESDLNVTRSYAAQGQAPERGSGGDWQRLYANSYAYTDALPAGVYKLDISGRSQSANSNSLDIDVRLADGTLVKTGNTVTWGNAVCSVQTFEGINVPEGASIVINNATEYNTNVALDYVIAYRTGDATEQITINEIGVSSYVTTYPLDFSNLTGVKALIATSETEDQIVMTKVTEVPANTPIIVRGTAGTYDVPVGSCTALSSTNLLKGSATESIDAGDVEGTVYALKKADGEFHKVAATVTIPAKIAYFVSTATTAGAKEIKSYTIFGEEETAVSSVNADTVKANVRLFNVAGQQVGAGYKGLVIDENGNKYIK